MSDAQECLRTITGKYLVQDSMKQPNEALGIFESAGSTSFNFKYECVWVCVCVGEKGKNQLMAIKRISPRQKKKCIRNTKLKVKVQLCDCTFV